MELLANGFVAQDSEADLYFSQGPRLENQTSDQRGGPDSSVALQTPFFSIKLHSFVGI